MKNWWNLTGSLEGFTVIIAKTIEEVDYAQLNSDEKSEGDEFIKQLKDCKASVFDISKAASFQSEVTSNNSSTAFEVKTFNTFGERPSLNLTHANLLERANRDRTIIIVDESLSSTDHASSNNYFTIQCLKLVHDLLKNDFTFSTFSEMESTLDMIFSCQPIYHQRKSNLGHLSEAILKTSVFCLSSRQGLAKDYQFERLPEEQYF